MTIAWRELLRRPGRFAVATVILTLIATLLMLLGGLLDGLVAQSTGAIVAQPGQLIVFSSTAEDSFVRSRITPEIRAEVEGVDGVRAVGGIGVVQLGGRVPGNEPRDLADTAIFGYELAPAGVPDPPATGEGYADETLKASGVRDGMTIAVGPQRTPIEIIGFVSATSYSGQGSVWTAPDTWRAAQNANRPDAAVGPDVFQSLVVEVDGDATSVARAIDEATGGATSTLTKSEAANAIGGVEQQRSVFNQIIGVTIVVAIVVVALFFALLTVERTALYGVLKAIGARSRTLFGGVILQAVVVTLVACTIGALLAIALNIAIPPGTIPYLLTPVRVISSTAFLVFASIVGCAFSLRRVLRIDPAAAIGSSS